MPLPPSAELINPAVWRGTFRVALFDFDGTLSLIREGWPSVMAELISEVLVADVPDVVDEIVVGLNGQPTVVQMTRLAEVVAARGGQPASPVEYLRRYDE